jgi:hypothetical protein
MALRLLIALSTLLCASGLPLATQQRTQTFFSAPIELVPAGIGFVKATPLQFPPGRIAISSVVSDFVDASGDPVPLDTAYMHHWFVHALDKNDTVVADFGAGSEFRRVPEAFDAPYGFVMTGDERWSAQLHVIDLRIRDAQDRLPCVECRRRQDCQDGSCVAPSLAGKRVNGNYSGGIYACNWSEEDATAGSARCAAPSATAAMASYRLKYDVTYTELDDSGELSWDRLHAVTLKAEAPYAEYDVPTCAIDGSNPMCVHTKQSSWVYKAGQLQCTSCPTYNAMLAPGRPITAVQAVPPARKLGLIWAAGHQHDGSMGVELWLKQPGESVGKKLFESLPEYGSQPGVPGNELGFVVGFSIGRWTPPVEIEQGATLTVVSKYEAHSPGYNTTGFVAGPEVARTGVMGYMRLKLVVLE